MGVIVTHCRAAAAFSIVWLLLASLPAFAQSGGSRQLTMTPRETATSILCDGGTVSGGTCACPAGYNLLPAAVGAGGVCAQTNAENCRGGDLTVAGACLCNGRVTMSGETYALEFLGGKCVPKRCPVDTYLNDGKCVASKDRNFQFTCRTGYIPDAVNSGTPAAGLHCLPDPTFCPADLKRKNGSCPKLSAIAIDCFEGRCTCGPNADWVNYLCQCTEGYRDVDGSCVLGSAGTAARPRAEKKQAAEPELQSAEPVPRRTACPRGTVRSRGECVVVRRRYPAGGFDDGAYYWGGRTYRIPGYVIPRREP